MRWHRRRQEAIVIERLAGAHEYCPRVVRGVGFGRQLTPIERELAVIGLRQAHVAMTP